MALTLSAAQLQKADTLTGGEVLRRVLEQLTTLFQQNKPADPTAALQKITQTLQAVQAGIAQVNGVQPVVNVQHNQGEVLEALQKVEASIVDLHGCGASGHRAPADTVELYH
jgi:hypothetical protein